MRLPTAFDPVSPAPYAGLAPPSEPDAAEVRRLVDALRALRLNPDAGRVALLVEKPTPGEHVARTSAIALPGVGFAGDHARKDFYLGKRVPGREVSAVSADVCRVLGVDPLVVGDNLVVDGFDLATLRAGDHVRVGGVVLERSAVPHRPCPLFRARSSTEAYHAVRAGDFRGALFTVVQPGTVRVGDTYFRLPTL